MHYDAWGVTKKNFKPISATFQHLDHEIKDPDTWKKAKERMRPSSDRINWGRLQKNYKNWREEGAWIKVAPWFGYDVVNSRMCNTETILIAMADNPEWVIDMFNHGCDLTLSLLDLMWEKGYTFDEFMWFDDMAYKNGMLFSKTMWQECLKPYQKRVIDWAHQHGIKSHLHCCGNIHTLIPELIDLGVDMINPMEVKAGMDPAAIKQQYGKQLALMGGFDVMNWDKPEIVEEEIRRNLPVLKEAGGYLFASDHSVPDNISLENYQHIIKLVKEVGDYA